MFFKQCKLLKLFNGSSLFQIAVCSKSVIHTCFIEEKKKYLGYEKFKFSLTFFFLVVYALISLLLYVLQKVFFVFFFRSLYIRIAKVEIMIAVHA